MRQRPSWRRSSKPSQTPAHGPKAGPGRREIGHGALAERVQAFEREVIMVELKRNHYHITNVAKALGLERSHLYKKAEQLGIDLRALRKEFDGAAASE